MSTRHGEADAFFAALTPAGSRPSAPWSCGRRSAGLMWGKQFFHYDVDRWLAGDPAGTAAPSGPRTRAQRGAGGT